MKRSVQKFFCGACGAGRPVHLRLQVDTHHKIGENVLNTVIWANTPASLHILKLKFNVLSDYSDGADEVLLFDDGTVDLGELPLGGSRRGARWSQERFGQACRGGRGLLVVRLHAGHIRPQTRTARREGVLYGAFLGRAAGNLLQEDRRAPQWRPTSP